MRDNHALDDAVVIADWDLIAHAGGELLDAGRELQQTCQPLLSTLDTLADAFGTPAGAAGLARAHGVGTTDAQAMVELLGLSLDNDADSLYQVAFSLKATDEAIGRGLWVAR